MTVRPETGGTDEGMLARRRHPEEEQRVAQAAVGAEAGEGGLKGGGVRYRALAPLADRTFRTIWSASLLSNLGQLVLGVATAWEMTRLTNSPQTVALVQTALMLPVMLVAVPAGAFADMFDRRKVAISGLVFSAGAAAVLSVLSLLGFVGPATLLLFCFLIGSGTALYGPSWQASIPEQVTAEHLPAAIALGSVSYNIARSFGPALGGIIVLALGAQVAFAATALLYLPLIAAFLLWRRAPAPPRLPPERLDRAIISGIRYAIHAVTVRTTMTRVLAYCFASGSLMALAPLVAKQLLHGDAATFGILLCASGLGAIGGALCIGRIRERLSLDGALALTAIAMAAALLVTALSASVVLTCGALVLGGAANMLSVALLNVQTQVAVPRWVTARTLAWFASCLTGGLALGAWFWGEATARFGLTPALLASAATVLATPLLGLVMPLKAGRTDGFDLVEPSGEPNVALAITARSGPVVVELDYRVGADEARAFYDAMLKLQRARLRNGAFGWSLSRDIGDVEAWTERFQFPTWQDYLRHRQRFTQADLALQLAAEGYNRLVEPGRVRRRLERPFGSVRWRADTPAPSVERLGVYAP